MAYRVESQDCDIDVDVIHFWKVSRSHDPIRIPLSEREALRLALQVKPTKEMPRPGATKAAQKKKAAPKKRG
jgi:hypothetical protein